MSGEEARHECGLAAIHLSKPLKNYPFGGAAYYLYRMLLQQQNRGQLSAGITTFNPKREQVIDTYRKLGLVNEAFRSHHTAKSRAVMGHYAGLKGIGQVRYATCGLDDVSYAQPFERHHGRRWKWFAFAFNGNIANFSELKKEMEKKQYQLVRNLDTELILHHIEHQFRGDRKPELPTVFGNLANIFDGAYNIVFLNAEGTLAAMRDPLAFRPLSYAIDDDKVAVASESCALTNLGMNNVQSFKPGEMLTVENGSAKVEKFANSSRKARCMFEWVYFANAASLIDGKSVYQVRWRLGEQLAKTETLKVNDKDWIVVSVPDTAKPAADAYAHTLGLPSMEGLLRNRYVGRTFIEGQGREERVREKYNLNKAVLHDKKVILIEDSIVRGLTSKPLVKYIRDSGKAKEVHVRVSCPPIRAPCFYGIDMSTLQEMIAVRHMSKKQIEDVGFQDVDESVIEGIRKDIGADSLRYQSIDGLVKGINYESGAESLCMACLTGKYPTPFGEKLYQVAKQNQEKGIKGRTYEMSVKS
ncbi:MAG: amidophosphoribosyltransferase [archaeon GW2011_AR10]|nr:MAG: amidophosphoribosyltransferase [archaeon GW2011_AR10]